MKSTDLQTGRKLNEISLPRRYFGEGAALLDGLIYQLTWREGIAMVYDAVSFEKRSEFRYKGEGWGLTTDGKMLYMSDGSNRIYVLDPESFATIRTIEVHMGSSPVKYLNELEWIGSRIWANVYTTDQAVIIDPENGNVTGIIDLRGLLGPSDITPATDVLNGIAYDAQTGKIFVTGKNWNKIFEIEIIEK